VTPDQCSWVIGGGDAPMAPFDFVPLRHPADVDVRPAPSGQALGQMLEAGEIDALISAAVPQCVLDGSPNVARLFPDYESVERDYHRRTGIFPIMNTVVIRKELLASHPGLVQSVYQGFREAKDAAMDRYQNGRSRDHMDVMIPWFTPLFDRNRHEFPADWWPYGVDANRTTIDTFLRYFFEQGLSNRRLTCEDIFAPELLGT
jgi:hypothetical protein